MQKKREYPTGYFCHYDIIVLLNNSDDSILTPKIGTFKRLKERTNLLRCIICNKTIKQNVPVSYVLHWRLDSTNPELSSTALLLDPLSDWLGTLCCQETSMTIFSLKIKFLKTNQTNWTRIKSLLLKICLPIFLQICQTVWWKFLWPCQAQQLPKLGCMTDNIWSCKMTVLESKEFLVLHIIMSVINFNCGQLTQKLFHIFSTILHRWGRYPVQKKNNKQQWSN